MKRIMENINKFGDEYLIMDGKIPTISLGYVEEELILFNIRDKKTIKRILTRFKEITGKNIHEKYLISELSHGQRLILSALMALDSSANKILFIDFFTSISRKNEEKIKQIINEKRTEGKEIMVENYAKNN